MSKTVFGFVTIILLILFVSGCEEKKEMSPQQERAQAQALKNPFKLDGQFLDEGKSVYKQHCMICHLPKGEGPDYHSLQAMGKHHTEGDYYWVLNNGLNQTMGPGVMPPWKDKLTEREKWAVIAYIQQVLAQ